MPDIHVRACHFLEHRGRLALLRCFRGFAKSTLLAEYNAWKLWNDPSWRILHQGEADDTSLKTSRDTQNVLRHHPWTAGLLPDKQGTVQQWWVVGAEDARNASFYAKGILSNVTGSRANETQNDDVEVPRNIQTPEAREKLRYRLGEQVFIALPDAKRLFIGTPHTHDSIYNDIEALGAECLTIRMFEKEQRVETPTGKEFHLSFVPEYVFVGIYEHTRLLEAGVDYIVEGRRVIFKEVITGVLDFYANCAWPERFTRQELLLRRKETRTLNEWDSQYQLHSKPITEVRLNPERVIPYEVEPIFRMANKTPTMWLGSVQLSAMALRWDPAAGKLKSDISSASLILQDMMGRRYWHRAEALKGAVAEFTEDGKTIVGGQVWQLCDMVQQFNVPRITIETNGIGSFAPAILKAALKQRGLQCGVSEITASENKNKRILEAIEPLIDSQMLWAHTSVLYAVWEQMRDWNPVISVQPDDHLDSAAGAITDTPERLRHVGGKAVGIANNQLLQDWRPDGGAHSVQVDY